MIPILYESTETSFTSNGLGRLRDCISCVVTEERNGIYECDFEYPVDGTNYARIQCGRIITVTHDEGGDVQPFDIVSYSRPINGVVTFHCVHISYRQTALTVVGNNVNSLADALTMLETTTPANPFTYWTDKSGSAFMAAADGIPHSVRQVLGGLEGSILDTYGGEFEWDRWTVRLWQARGRQTDFTIRYGVNLLDYQEQMDYSDTYNSVIPYWTGQNKKGNDIVVIGSEVQSGNPSYNGTDRCIPLDLTEKFENKPTTAELETEAANYMTENQTYIPDQTIEVDFARLSDSDEYSQFAPLKKCRLCDQVRVVFGAYGMTGTFKIVKTVYDVLKDRYDKLELGTLSATLSDALGISQEQSQKLFTGSGAITLDDMVIETHTTPTLTGNGNYDNQILHITKADYYPIGIVGFQEGGSLSSYLHVFAMFLKNQTSGAADISYNRRVTGYSGSSTLSATITFYVLWIKE